MTIEAGHSGLLLAKLESSYGVEATPAMTDGKAPVEITGFDPDITTIDKMMVRPHRVSPGKTLGSIIHPIELVFKLAGAGNGLGLADGMAEPSYLDFLRCCEMTYAGSVTDPVAVDTYTGGWTSREAQSSMTLKYYRFDQDDPLVAKEYVLLGCKFVAEFSIGVDEEATVKFTGLGLFQAPTERTFTVDQLKVDLQYNPTEEQCDSATGMNMTLTLGGTNLRAKSVTIKSNRKVVALKDVNGQYGHSYIGIVSDGGPGHMVEVDPFEDLNSVRDVWTPLLAETGQALVIQMDSVKGTRQTFNGPDVQIAEQSSEDDEGYFRQPLVLCARDCAGVIDNAITHIISKTP